MFESLAAPWILLSMSLFYNYRSTRLLRYVVGSTAAASIAFVLRQQAGIGALTIPILLILAKDIRGFAASAGVGLLCFVLAGIPDIFLRGGFHHSLISVLTYNVEHGHEYGNGSILFYPLLLMGMTFFPFLWFKILDKKFSGMVFKKLDFAWVFIVLFVALHSYFPQKFERFMVSIIPLVIILMTPYFTDLLMNWPKSKGRLTTIAILNLFILVNASFFPSQKNIINMALFIDRHPQIKSYYNLEKTIEWIPEKFISPNREYALLDSPLVALKDHPKPNCDAAYIVNDFLWQENVESLKDFHIVETFQVNWIEHLAYRFNKKNNIRRAPLHVLSNCSQPRP